MKLYNPLPVLLLLLCSMQVVRAQEDTTAAQMEPVIDNNRVTFQPVLRPLRQVAGAPEAFYSYFWEFGDGTYSFEKQPVHTYKDTGVYEVRLFATNNYDDGKKPNTRPRPIPVNRKSMLADNTIKPFFFTGNGALEIKTNQQPKPGEDLVLLLGYRNRPGSHMAGISGSVMLLYNEKQFSQNSFDISDVRKYNYERPIGLDSLVAYAPLEETLVPEQETRQGLFTVSAANYTPPADRLQLKQFLKEEMSMYRQHNIWRVNEVKPGEEKFLFISVNTLPEMIKDTNAVVTIAGLFIPDDPSQDVEKFELELQIVASHDPNRILLKKRRLNYRFTGKNKDNIYKIRFQNTGKGPAKKVAITVTVPGMLNAATVDVLDMKPACTWCDSARPGQSCIDTVITKDSLQFVFRNIYLPGTQQEGVSDPDSTMGFIRYKLRFTKKMRKMPFTSRAAIVFDKNEPVYTNRSIGKFRKGISPGIILGYNVAAGSSISSVARQQYNIGFTISEYAAYKKYFQWELYLQPSRQYESFEGRRFGGDTVLNGVAYKVEFRDAFNRVKVFSAELVPIEFRYNLSSFASAGAGALLAAEISREITRLIRTHIQSPNQGNLQILEGEKGKQTRSFATWREALFADVQLGKVRVGPVAGFRFLQYFNPSHQRMVFYLGWKF
jgi:PKD domain